MTAGYERGSFDLRDHGGVLSELEGVQVLNFSSMSACISVFIVALYHITKIQKVQRSGKLTAQVATIRHSAMFRLCRS